MATPDPRESHVGGNSANGAMLSPKPAAIEVYSGGFVDLLNPDPATLKLEDIARGLGFTCRYGGHVSRFYSVAEHAVLVHDLLRERGASAGICKAALFHDAAEALLGDVVAPLKWALRYQEIADDAMYHGPWPPDPAGHRSAYDVLTERMEAAICQAFDVKPGLLELGDIRVADMWALRIEARELTRTGGANWRWPGELPLNGELPTSVVWYGDRGPNDAAAMWLKATEPYVPPEIRDAA